MERLRDPHDVRERRALRVQVEDQPVRALERGDARAPDVDRDRAHVRHVAEGLGVVDDEVVDVALGVLRVDALRADPVGRELRRVLLEERLARDPVGIAGEDDRPVAEVGERARARSRRSTRSGRPWCSPRPARRPSRGSSGERETRRGRPFGREAAAGSREALRGARRPRRRIQVLGRRERGAGVVRPVAPSGVSRRQSSGRLSSRSPRNVGWRRPPSRVHSVNRTSQTSRGSTQWWPRPAGVPASNGDVSRRRGSSCRQSRSSSAPSKPVPTFDT